MKKITSVCPYCGAGCKLQPVGWEEAFSYTAKRLKAIKEQHGPRAIMTTESSRGTGNETNYVMQKFARGVLKTNNVDCCARVCHGASVAGLQVTLGNGAMSNTIGDIEKSKCLLVFGYNCADSHPIVARRVIKAKENGAKIIVCDPRRIETARIADQHLQLKNGCNMALVNAFAHVLLEENLYDKEYVAKHTEGLEAYREIVKGYAPEDVEHLTGVPAQQVRQAMRTFAAAPSATIMWGMGVTQFSQAVNVVKGLSSLALLTGNCAALQTLADEPGFVQMHPEDAVRLGIKNQQLVWVRSRRGRVISRADVSERINKGSVYMTYQWWIGACNELTQDNLDPVSKTPETKYCAVNVSGIADQQWAETYAQTTYSEMKARLRQAAEASA